MNNYQYLSSIHAKSKWKKFHQSSLKFRYSFLHPPHSKANEEVLVFN